MQSEFRFAKISPNQRIGGESAPDEGSITFNFCGDFNDSGVQISQQGELSSDDLELLVGLINQQFMLKRLIESGDIKPSSMDPTGRGQLLNAWSN